MNIKFLNEIGDIEWLCDTHLSTLPFPAPPFNSFVIVGNEDAPSEIHLYTDRDPLHTAAYLRIVFGEHGTFVTHVKNGADAVEPTPPGLAPRLTTPIDRLGQYRTRGDQLVRIAAGHSSGEWSGWIARANSRGELHKQWSVWPASGLFGDAPAYDIVAYIGE